MSAGVLHVNLMSPHEQRSSSPVRLRVMLPAIGIVVGTFMILWAAIVGAQLIIANIQLNAAKKEIAKYATDSARSRATISKFAALKAENEQYRYFMNGKVDRGEFLRLLALAIPENISLTSLVIPPPPPQNLTRPKGSTLPPLQGPTSTVDRVEIRLTGLADSEQDVFQLMSSLKGEAFTNMIQIVEHPVNGENESPRVLAFRQEAPAMPGLPHAVFFDIIYDLKPREYVK